MTLQRLVRYISSVVRVFTLLYGRRKPTYDVRLSKIFKLAMSSTYSRFQCAQSWGLRRMTHAFQNYHHYHRHFLLNLFFSIILLCDISWNTIRISNANSGDIEIIFFKYSDFFLKPSVIQNSGYATASFWFWIYSRFFKIWCKLSEIQW